ncbi:MAG: hypothetical protein Q8934_02770 [Bacillota bacterium]|nr:hypothetical protein [Bacillota bacterium]
MEENLSLVVKKKEQFKIYAQEPFTEEWREVKEINFEDRNFVFKGEHFENNMDYYSFKVEIY